MFTIITRSKMSYGDKLKVLDIATLEDRRLKLIVKFLEKAVNHPRFSGRWFPLKFRNQYGTRHEERYLEYKCNTERNRANPLIFFRRRLNNA